MKKLLIALLLNCATIAPICADQAVIGCKILLEKGDFVKENDNIFIKHEVQNEIFESVKAWQLLEFKVFIYATCDHCGGLYLVDNGCTNPNCVKLN
jgi:hypothetical protein